MTFIIKYKYTYETTFPSMVVNCFSVHLNVLGTLSNLEVNCQLQTSQNIDRKSDWRRSPVKQICKFSRWYSSLCHWTGGGGGNNVLVKIKKMVNWCSKGSHTPELNRDYPFKLKTQKQTWSPNLKGAEPTSPEVSSKRAPWFSSTRRFILFQIWNFDHGFDC